VEAHPRLRSEDVTDGHPLLLATAGTGVVDIWLLDTTADATSIENHSGVLTEAEGLRAQQLRHPEDRKTFMITHTALRLLLGRYLSRAPETLALIHNSRGKPRLPGNPLHFSLSRRRGRAAIAIAETAIGIDLENVPPSHLVADALRWLHPLDRRDVLAQPLSEQASLFTTYWTRLEAFSKVTGHGLDPEIRSVRVGSVNRLRRGALDIHIKDFAVGPDFRGALAVAPETEKPFLRDRTYGL